MAAPLTHTLGGIDIPRTLVWTEEFNWVAPVSAHEYSITGALIVDTAMRQAGRPITLQGVAEHGWVRRGALQGLYALVNSTTGTLPLVLADGRTFTVRFAPDSPITADPIARAELPTDQLPYAVTLRLIAV